MDEGTSGSYGLLYIIWVSAEAEFAIPVCQVLKELQAQELTKVKRTLRSKQVFPKLRRW